MFAVSDECSWYAAQLKGQSTAWDSCFSFDCGFAVGGADSTVRQLESSITLHASNNAE